MNIDLNADLGEGFGAYRLGDPAALLDCITSANMACGFHAGDPGEIHRCVEAAARRGMAVEAHPDLPDLLGFGRREMAVGVAEVYELTLYQIGAVAAFARAAGVPLRHVKPYGGLYNMAARRLELAQDIVQTAQDFSPSLIIFGLSGSA